MFPKTRAIGEYVYDDYPEYTDVSEHAYEEGSNAPYSRNATNDDDEYVYDEAVYVVEKKSGTKYPNQTNASHPEIKKPGHKRTDPGIYDELDYELSPSVEVDLEGKGVNHDKTILTDSTTNDVGSKKKKTIIGSVLGVSVVAAIFGSIYFGADFSSRGGYDLLYFSIIGRINFKFLNQGSN